MKFINHINIETDLDTAVAFLNSNGIMATNAAQYANIPTKRVAARNIKQGIWIHINQQYDDAIQLLQDPNHVPNTALSPEEMGNLDQLAKAQFTKLMNKFIVGTCILISGVALFLWFTYN